MSSATQPLIGLKTSSLVSPLFILHEGTRAHFTVRNLGKWLIFSVERTQILRVNGNLSGFGTVSF